MEIMRESRIQFKSGLAFGFTKEKSLSDGREGSFHFPGWPILFIWLIWLQ